MEYEEFKSQKAADGQGTFHFTFLFLQLLILYTVFHIFLKKTLEIKSTQHFNYQLMHTTLKNVELLKHSKISKTAPTCFGLQGNHLQGAKVST